LTLADVCRLIDRFAHDVNNGVAVMLGFSELLLTDAANTREHEAQLTDLRRAARQVATLAEDLRTQVSVEAARSAPAAPR
jgi:signal transduction histidine kinase